MLNTIKKDAESRMLKCIDALKVELGKLRTGRAHPNLLEQIKVSYYGTDTPLSQLANITVESSQTLLVSPWEKNIINDIDRAIRQSDLGLNPATSSDVIRVPLPPLTEERRKEFIKLVREEGEKGKISIRNIRRDANTSIKDLLKDKEISEDEARDSENAMQKLTDKHIHAIDDILKAKETELMTV